jgi:hypothetical protein
MRTLGSFGERFPRFHPFATRIAHWHGRSLMLALALQVPVIAWAHAHHIEWGMLPLLMVCALPSFFVGLASHYHSRALCTYCADQTPVNIGAIAERRRWLLWISHSGLFMAIEYSAFLAALLTLRHFYGRNGFDYAWLAIYVIWAKDAYVMHWHRLLQPACPYCPRWDEGGEHEEVPEPVPPAGSRTPTPVKVTT